MYRIPVEINVSDDIEEAMLPAIVGFMVPNSEADKLDKIEDIDAKFNLFVRAILKPGLDQRMFELLIDALRWKSFRASVEDFLRRKRTDDT